MIGIAVFVGLIDLQSRESALWVLIEDLAGIESRGAEEADKHDVGLILEHSISFTSLYSEQVGKVVHHVIKLNTSNIVDIQNIYVQFFLGGNKILMTIVVFLLLMYSIVFFEKIST